MFILDHVITSRTQHRAVSLVDKEHARRWCCRWSRSSRIDEHKSSNQRTRVVADSDNAIEKGAYECKPLRLRRLWSTPVASYYRSVSALLGAQIVFLSVVLATPSHILGSLLPYKRDDRRSVRPWIVESDHQSSHLTNIIPLSSLAKSQSAHGVESKALTHEHIFKFYPQMSPTSSTMQR